MTTCVPTVSDVVAPLDATPPARATGAPRGLPSTRNWTLPVGVPPPLVTEVVNVTPCPKTEGFADEVTAVVVAAAFTWWVTPADVLARKSVVAT